MPIVNSIRRAISDHMFRTSSWSKPTQLYIGLLSILPNPDGTGYVEIVGNGYARVQRNPSDANWLQVIDGIVTNAAPITFPDPSGGPWGSIVGVGVWNESGVLLRYMPLTSSVTVNADDQGPSFATGAIQFSQV